MARYGVNRLGIALFGPAPPLSTLAVNVLGSFLIGLVAAHLTEDAAAGQPWRLFLATGVLGGFTTFSAFSLDALTLWQRGQPGTALLYVLGSVILSLTAVAIGAAVVRL